MSADLDDALKAAVDSFHAGDLPASKATCETVLAHVPQNPLALNLMALIARAAKKWGKAEEIANRGFEANPGYPDLANTLGLVRMDQRKWDDATSAFRQALSQDTTSPLYLSNLARAEMGGGNLQAALATFDKALASDPQFVAALTGRASLLVQAGRLDDADLDLRNAARSAPKSPDVLATRGVLLLARGDLEGAYSQFDKVSAVSPDTADALVNRGLIRLLQGRIAEGWEDYGQRRKRRYARAFARHQEIPAWDGSALDGKSLLVWCEQGLGEAILGASQLESVIAEADRVSVECNPRLSALFSRSFPNVDVVPQTDPPHDRISADTFDMQISMFDLIGRRVGEIDLSRSYRPYLKADPSRAEEIRQRYQKELGEETLIGISWESPQALTAGQKSVPVAVWAQLLKNPGLGFVNIQYGSSRSDMDGTVRDQGARWLDDQEIDPMGDLDAFAAQLAALDLVITVSNTTAHLSAALGTETWILVPPLGPASMWYWFTDRSDSPWYGAARLFRRQYGQDAELLRGIAAELAERT